MPKATKKKIAKPPSTTQPMSSHDGPSSSTGEDSEGTSKESTPKPDNPSAASTSLGFLHCNCERCQIASSASSAAVPCWSNEGGGRVALGLMRTTVKHLKSKCRALGMRAFNELFQSHFDASQSDVQNLASLKPEVAERALQQSTLSSPLAADLLCLVKQVAIIIWKLDQDSCVRLVKLDHSRALKEFLSVPNPNAKCDRPDWQEAKRSMEDRLVELMLYLFVPVAMPDRRTLQYLLFINKSFNPDLITIWFGHDLDRYVWLQAYLVNFRTILQAAWRHGVDQYVPITFHEVEANLKSSTLQLTRNAKFLESLPKKQTCNVCKKSLAGCSDFLYPAEFSLCLGAFYPRKILRLEGREPETWTKGCGDNFNEGGGDLNRTIGIVCQPLCFLENERTFNPKVNKFMLNLHSSSIYEKLTKKASLDVNLSSEAAQLKDSILDMELESEQLFAVSALSEAVKNVDIVQPTVSMLNLPYCKKASPLKPSTAKEACQWVTKDHPYDILTYYRSEMAKTLSAQSTKLQVQVCPDVKLRLYRDDGSIQHIFETSILMSGALQPFQPLGALDSFNSVKFCFFTGEEASSSSFSSSKGPAAVSHCWESVLISQSFFTAQHYKDGIKFLVNCPDSRLRSLLDHPDRPSVLVFVKNFNLTKKTCNGGFLYVHPKSKNIIGVVVVNLFDVLTAKVNPNDMMSNYNDYASSDFSMAGSKERVMLRTLEKGDKMKKKQPESDVTLKMTLLRNLAMRRYNESLPKAKRWKVPLSYYQLMIVCRMESWSGGGVFIMTSYIVLETELVGPTVERFVRDLGEDVTDFRYHYHTNREMKLDKPIDPAMINEPKNRLDPGCKGLVMSSVMPKPECKFSDYQLLTNEERVMNCNDPELCKLTVRMEVGEKKVESLFLVPNEDPLKLLLETSDVRDIRRFSKKDRKVGVFCVEPPTAALQPRIRIQMEDLQAASTAQLCSEMGVSPRELTLLFTDDPIYLEEQVFDPTHERLSSIRKHWRREGLGWEHFNQDHHYYVWRGFLGLHGSPDVLIGMGLGLCNQNQADPDSLETWKNMYSKVQWGRQLDVIVLDDKQPHNRLEVFTRHEHECFQEEYLVFCACLASSSTPASGGDAVRSIVRIGGRKRKSDGKAIAAIIPFKSTAGMAFMTVRMKTEGQVCEIRMPTNLEKAAQVYKAFNISESCYSLGREPKLLVTLPKDYSYLMGIVSTTFGSESFSFAITGKSALRLKNFFEGIDADSPVHRLRPLPLNFSFHDSTKWSNSSRVVSLEGLDPAPPKTFVQLCGKSRSFICYREDPILKTHVFLIMKGCRQNFTGYFPTAAEREEILEELEREGPACKSDLARYRPWREAVVDYMEWNTVRSAVGMENILPEDFTARNRRPIDRPIVLKDLAVNAKSVLSRLAAFRQRAVQELLQDPDVLAPSLCAFCSKEGYDLKVCIGCKVTFYCSLVCMKKNSFAHSKECGQIEENRFKEALKRVKIVKNV